jgi:hypothetical protein
VELGSPSEYDRGAPPDSALAVFPPALAGGSGPPLLGFFVPTALCSGMPGSATIGGADRGRRGLPPPRPCRPRAFSAPRRVRPRRRRKTRVAPDPPATALAPELCGLVSCRNALGIRPSEPSPLGEPCRLLGGRPAPMRVRPPPSASAAAPVRRERFPPSATGRAVRQVREDPRHDSEVGRGFPRSPRPPITARVAPHGERDDRPGSPGSQAHRPCRPLRSFAPSESPFARRPTRNPGLRPNPVESAAGPLLSWDSALLEPSPPRPRVRMAARAPGEPDTPGRPRPVPEVGTRAPTPRPRPSESSDSDGWPPEPRHRRTLAASAPPLGGAPSSLALHPPRAARAARGGRTSEA